MENNTSKEKVKDVKIKSGCFQNKNKYLTDVKI